MSDDVRAVLLGIFRCDLVEPPGHGKTIAAEGFVPACFGIGSRAVDDVPLAGVRTLDLMHRADDIIECLPVPHRIVPVVFDAYGDPHPAGELFAQMPEQ